MSYTSSYSNPEQVLKAAEELQNLNKEAAAYESLYNYMVSSRAKPWSVALEKIMLLLIELSLKNKRTNLGSLSDPLRNFRNATQYNNIQSLESTLEKYCIMAEEVLDKTSKKMDYKKLLDDEDLEESDNTELYINSISTEINSNKEELKAAWRLVWDTYRTTIDSISRHNKLESLYQRTIEKALEFCKKYNRKNEAKRLFDSAHNNLINLFKNLDPTPENLKYAFLVDIRVPETNEIQISIRLNLLQYAHHFELWQEGIKALEGINRVMQKSEKAIKPKILSEYFENLAKMFWKSEFFLYHAHAFFSHFSLCKSKSRLTSEELRAKSSYLILSVLSIAPIQAEQDQSDDARNKALTLLSSSSTSPSKESLIAYLMRHNIVDLCVPEVRELYFIMENTNDIVLLAKQVEEILEKLSKYKDLDIFKAQLRKVVVYKVLTVISNIYKTIRIEKLKRFIGSVSYSTCENILQHVAVSGFIKIRIDHSRNLITFHNKSDDLQNMTMKISSISEEVQDVMSMLENRLEEANEAALRKKLREDAELFMKNSRQDLKKRQEIITVLRKGEEEKIKIEVAHDREKERVRLENEQKHSKEEEKRNHDAHKKMLIDRELNIVDTQKRQKLVAEIKGAKTAKIHGKKIADYTEDELMTMTYDVLEDARDKLRQEEKAKEETKLKNLFKKVDYIERAKREETTPILKQSWEGSVNIRAESLKRHKEVFETYQERKKTLLNVKSLKETHVKTILAQRKENYEKDFKSFIEKVQKEIRVKILQEAKESLVQHRKKLEEVESQKQAASDADRKRIEREQKDKDLSAQLKDAPLARSNMTRNTNPTATAAVDSRVGSDSKGGLIRSTLARDAAPKDQPTPITSTGTGLSRNMGGLAKNPVEESKDSSNKFTSGSTGKPKFTTRKDVKKDEPQPKQPEPTGMMSRNVSGPTPTTSTTTTRNLGGTSDSNPPNKFVRNTAGDKKDGDAPTRTIGGKSASGPSDGWTTIKKH